MSGRLRKKKIPTNGMSIEECRRLYKEEMLVLWREVEGFRATCKQEMVKQKSLVTEHAKKCQKAISLLNDDDISAPDINDNPDFPQELRKLEENMVTLEKKQRLLDSEQDLLEKEEALSRKSSKLREFEKDVEEAEILLNKRETLVKRRSQEIELLSQDLLAIRTDLETSLQREESKLEDQGKEDGEEKQEGEGDNQATYNSPEASTKARRNWQLARRHLVDKVSLLEATVQRYRTQVASSSAQLTAKDMLIDRLQKENSQLKEDLSSREKRLKQLEARLALTVQDKARSEHKLEMLLEELQNIDLTANSKMLHLDSQTTKSQMGNRSSLFSFLSPSHGSKGAVDSPSSLRKRFHFHKKGQNKQLKRADSSDNEQSPQSNTNSSIDSAQSLEMNGFSDSDNNADDSGSKACIVM